ncbi:MAG: prepilin-type N-terminal cleavage/methylation domain-containing protein [Candidatus Doudnabacteria bacterium]
MKNKLPTTNYLLPAKPNGFTLIEVVISVAVFSIIAMGIVALVSSVLVNSTQAGSLLANNDSARRAVFGIMQELRNAATSSVGAYALESAGAQQLIFYTNSAGSINRVRYFLQSGALKKGVTIPTGSPLIYNLAAETVTEVQKDVANGANPIFYYYDGTYDGNTNNFLIQPVNVTAVTFVKMNLTIYKRINSASTATYTETASGAIRNLKTNLAN